MAKFRYQHIKSSVEGKAPTAAQLKVAEIGVNDFAGSEKLFIKNSENEVVDFPRGYSREYIDEQESVVAASLNDLEDKKADKEDVYEQFEVISASLNDLEDKKADEDDVYEQFEVISEALNDLEERKANEDDLEAFGEITAAALNDLESRKLDATAYTPTDLSNYYTKSETSGATEIANALAEYFDDAKYELSGATHVINFYNGNTIKATVDATDFIKDGMIDTVSAGTSGSTTVLVITWNTDAGKSQTVLDISDVFEADNYYAKSETSGATEIADALSEIDNIFDGYYTKTEIDDADRVISESLNDLNERKLDASAYTPTDLTNYYTKDETSGATELSTEFANYYTTAQTSGATELSTAFGNKADTATTLAGYGITDAYTKSETSGATEIANALDGKANVSDIADFFDDAKYELSGTTHVINFYNGNTVKATVDATDFIKDGMIDTVSAGTSGSTTVLVITWNTDAGKSQTVLDIGDMFEADNYYTKSETSGATEIADALDEKSDTGHTHNDIYYTKADIESNERVIAEALNDLKANKLDISAYTPTDLSNYYTKSETSGATELTTAFGNKADTATTLAGYGITDAYTKSETSGATEIADALDGFYTKDYIDEIEEVISSSLNDLNTRKANKLEDLDNIVLKRITQSDYDALVQAGTTDPDTLYIITD